MKKLGKLKLQNATLLNDREMKNIVGGYGGGYDSSDGYNSSGTCAAYVPGIKSFDWDRVEPGTDVQMDHNRDVFIFRQISSTDAQKLIYGVSGAKWCCDSCDKASWF